MHRARVVVACLAAASALRESSSLGRAWRPTRETRDESMLRESPRASLEPSLAPSLEPSRRGDASRREALASAAAMTAAAASPALALPSDNAGALTTLRRRAGQRTGALPSYGLDARDVYYPDWFSGLWRVESKAIDVSAPLGPGLFGGNASLAAAVKELDAPPVVYEARWVRAGAAPYPLVADRPFNIASLAAATMGGADAILGLPGSNFDPNRLIFKLAPPDAGGQVYRAELGALARRFEPASRRGAEK